VLLGGASGGGEIDLADIADGVPLRPAEDAALRDPRHPAARPDPHSSASRWGWGCKENEHQPHAKGAFCPSVFGEVQANRIALPLACGSGLVC